ncbi:hypothetical protein QL285_050086 [Trifolium repens]|jgi:hypothetical protein|nr:hypothetical protein QL285_050086 [Trifolium repens]
MQLRKFNTRSSDDSVVSFILAFESLLDQFFRELQSITEVANKLSLQTTAHSQEWSMVEDSIRRIADIERNAKEENEEVIALLRKLNTPAAITSSFSSLAFLSMSAIRLLESSTMLHS